MRIWPNDPKNGQPSVSLGLVVLSTVCLVAAIVLDLLGKAKGTGIVTEFFYGSIGLYFGRRMTFGKGQIAGPVDNGDQK